MRKVPDIHDYPGCHIHMIGIGGSSMSGLAEMLLDRGYTVTGSDRTDGYLLGALRERGIPVAIGHSAENVRGADFIVYTGAIPEDNPERAAARELGIPGIERSDLLGQLMAGSREAVAVCGAHGKTSTTSMLSQIAMACGLDPSIHIGGQLDAIGGSTRVGHSGVFIAEACEFRRSFLRLKPTLAVVMNIDADHLDCYRDIDEIEETFGTFLSLLPEDGLALGNGDDARVTRQLGRLACRTETFGIAETNTWHPANLTEDAQGYASFDVVREGSVIGRVRMAVPGRFNVMNALAALAASIHLGAGPAEACAALEDFRGAHRRFELTDVIDGAELYTDYGHNPAEMRNAMAIARKRADALGGRLIAVMQPHTFSRVRSLFADYLTCTEAADITIVTDICAAREPDPGDLNSGMLVDGMRAHGLEAYWTPSFDDAEAWLRSHWRKNDVAVTMGCGDINMLNVQMHRHEEEKAAEAGR